MVRITQKKRKNEKKRKAVYIRDSQRGWKKSKRKPFDQRLRERLEEEMVGGVTYEEALFKAMVKAGLKGSVQAFNALNDRAYGKAKQPIQLSGSLEHEVVESPITKFNDIQKKIEALEKKQKKKK